MDIAKSSSMQNGDMRKSLISPVINSSSRGAKFLNLVRSPQLSKRISCSAKKNNVMDLMQNQNGTKANDDYLKFSPSIHYDPSQSPSQGILSKRKPETPDSPSAMNASAKRKRVSFNDPVSTTKQYIITEEEERLKSNSLIRCLTYENQEEEEEEDVEMPLVDKIPENQNNSNDAVSVVKDDNNEKEVEIKQEIEDDEEEKLLADDPILLDHNYEITQNTDITTSTSLDEPLSLSATDCLMFKNKNELMDYVTKNLTVDELFERLTQAEEQSIKRKELIEKVFRTIDMNELLNEIIPCAENKSVKMTPEQTETTSTIVNHISKLMKSNERVKHKVLETLSEKHSKDFLTHALQENSISAVCEKLTIQSIINYLIHKVNVCENDELDLDMNKMNRAIMHHLLKSTHNNQEIVSDHKETQELLKLLFKNKPKIDVLDTVHEFLRNIIQQK